MKGIKITAAVAVAYVATECYLNRKVIKKRSNLAIHVLRGRPLVYGAGHEMGTIQLCSGGNWLVQDVVVRPHTSEEMIAAAGKALVADLERNMRSTGP